MQNLTSGSRLSLVSGHEAPAGRTSIPPLVGAPSPMMVPSQPASGLTTPKCPLLWKLNAMKAFQDHLSSPTRPPGQLLGTEEITVLMTETLQLSLNQADDATRRHIDAIYNVRALSVINSCSTVLLHIFYTLKHVLLCSAV